MTLRSVATGALLAMGFFALAVPLRAEVSVDQLKTKLEKVSEQLDGDYVPVGRVRSGGLGEGQSEKFEQVLRKDACYRFVAVGGEKVVDLDLKIFAGGKVLSKDDGKVTAPVVEYCAKKDTKAELRLQLFSGTGAWALGVFAKGDAGEGGQSNMEEAARLALEQYAAEIAADMDPLGKSLTGSLGHRNSENLDVTLDQRRCYKFIAVGGKGVQDLTMSVLVDGKEVASDRISGKKPVAQWCAPGRLKAKIKLSMYGGAGSFAVGVYGARKSGIVSPEKVGGAEKDFIANRIRQLHAQHGKGRAAVSPVFRGNLSTNNEQVFKVKLSSGHCYSILGVGSPSVKDLDVTLLTRSGRELQKDKSRNSFPVLDTNPCPTTTGTYTIRAKMSRGFGQFGVQVFSD